MAGEVVAFRRRKVRPAGWSEEERGDLARLFEALGCSQLRLDYAEGVTDEGEPWASWSCTETGEIFLHAARIADIYRLSLVGQPMARCGNDLGLLLDGWIGPVRPRTDEPS